MGTVFRRTYLNKKTGKRRRVRVYSVRFKNANGKWITEPAKATKKYLAERLLHQRETEVEQQRNGSPAAITPSEVQDAYLEEIKNAYLADRKIRVSHETYRLYQERLSFTLADLGHERMSQLTLEAIDSYVDRRLDRDVSPRTVNIQITVLRRMIQHAVDREFPGVVRNPLKRWRPLRETPKKKRRALEPDEVQRLFENAPVHRRMIWAVALATGMRRKELVLMRLEDYHPDQSLVVVRPEVAKNGRRRVVPIPDELARLLDEWLERDLPHRRLLMDDYLTTTRRKLAEYEETGEGDLSQAEALRHLEDKIVANRDHCRLFRNGRGLPYLKSNLLRELRGDLKRARIDLRGMSLHALRLTNATLLRAANVSEVACLQRLGHHSIDLMNRRYTDFDRVDSGEGTDAVAKFLGVSNGQPKPRTSCSDETTAGSLGLQSDEPLRPTPEILRAMIKGYSNILVGRVFGVSEAAVRKWLKKWDIVRRQRQLTKDEMTEADIGILRAEVRIMLARSADDARR